MNSDEKFWLIFWGILCATVCFIAICITTYNMNLNKTYLEGGYEQQMVPGSGFPVWKKVAK